MRAKISVMLSEVLFSALLLSSLAAQTTNAGPAVPVTGSGPIHLAGFWSFRMKTTGSSTATAISRAVCACPTQRRIMPDWSAVPLVPAWYGDFFDGISFLDASTAVASAGVYAQQNMYTPNNNNLNPPDPNDYPYSGWVGLGTDLIRQTADRRAIFEANVGWVGPYSGAEDLQDAFHSLIGSHKFQGWDDQLKNEPVLQFAYQQDWRLAALSNLNAATPGSFCYDFIPHVRATVGNGWDYAAAGFVARWGYQVPMDFGPARMRLGDIDSAPYAAPGAGKSSGGDWSLDALSAYVCFGAEGRAVARDITLDGNTLANSASVVHKPFVGEVYTGLVTQYKNFRASMLFIYESDTFDSQPQPGQWRGALTLGWQF